MQKKIMQKKNSARIFLMERLLPIIFFVIVIFLLFAKPVDEKALGRRINESIERSKVFLANKDLTEDIYAADYDICMAGSKKCPFDNETFLYKQIDASLDFVFLKDEPMNVSGLEKKIEEADKFLRSVLQELPNKSIDYSYIDNSREKGDFALDLYCILGWTYNDTAIYGIVRSELNPYGWVNPRTSDDFRKLIDETWCISLLAQNSEDEQTIRHQLNIKQSEFYEFVNGTQYQDRKVVSAAHLLLMFDRLEKYGYDVSEYKDLIEFSKSYIVDSINGKYRKLSYPLEDYHLALYPLSMIHYTDKTFLQGLAEKILQMQNDDGSWIVGTLNRYRVMSTLRCMMALNLFKTNYL